MFVFQFNFEGPAKDYLIREEVKAARMARLIVFFLTMIPAIAIGIIWYYNYIVLIISMGIVLLSFTFLIVVKQWDNPIKELPNVIPTTITIEDDKIVRSGFQSYRLVNIQDIKEIWDMGSFYAIIFYFPNMDRRFICQKDLLVEGTIEEFEQLFEGLIVRKYETKD